MYRPYLTQRAQRRSDAEDNYGNKISLNFSNTTRISPYTFPARRITKNSELYAQPPFYGMPPPTLPPPYHGVDNYINIPSSYPPGYKVFVNPSTGAISKNPNDLQYTFDEQFQLNYLQQSQTKNLPQNLNASQNLRSIRGVHAGSILADFTNNKQWRPHSSSFSEGQRRNRTCTETTNKQTWIKNIGGSFNSLHTPDNEDTENYPYPVLKTVRSNSLSNTSSPSSPVDLLVTNLDQTLDPQDLKNMLLLMFQEHVMVLNLLLFQQSDGNLAANLRVPSIQDAQYVISQLHRRKVGHKRILISYVQPSSTNPQVLRSQVIDLLQEVPGNRMPLFKFRELLETRYRSSVSVSELYKLRDVCSVSEEFGARMISLCPDLRTASASQLSPESALESPYCLVHCPNGLGERGWAEPETPSLPNVRIKLKVFSTKVHELLHSHMGTMPLSSFSVCYNIENSEKLPTDETGVPLEHLITCVVGVKLRYSSNMVKYLLWDSQINGDDRTNEVTMFLCPEGNTVNSTTAAASAALKAMSPPLATQLALFSRELVDLLKTAPHCQLLFSRFIPAYHHHFGRQCRVADYGHTKLVDLFDSLPHIVQIIGEGNKRIITLSHSTQIRRFTSDLLRVLKSQVSKQVILSEFGAAYERVLLRPFDPVDYGLCEFSDLLDEVSENVVVIKKVEDDIVVAIPKNEQTPEEIVKTKQFAVEVVDLLKYATQYGMPFNKFVPAYHHHFGHQCRVSDYGFTKLIELFEAIPEVVKIEETSDGERRVSLTPKEALKVIRQQLISLVQSSKLQSVALTALPAIFIREHGYPLRPELYECESTEDLINKLSGSLQLVNEIIGTMVTVVEETAQQHLGIRIWSLLLNHPHNSPVNTLLQNYYYKYRQSCTLQELEKHQAIITITKRTDGNDEITLTSRYALAARLYHLLYENGGSILLGNVDGIYFRKYGKVLRPAEYEATSLNALLSQFPFLVVIKGRRNKRNVSLNTSISASGVPLPPNLNYKPSDNENYTLNNNSFQWPPPPLHTYFFNMGRTVVSPPKPDTPPTHGSSLWNTWSPSQGFNSSPNLCIPLPFLHTPPLLGNPATLISPMKNLLPAFPPENGLSEVPMSNAEVSTQGKTASPSRDSGISSTSFSNSMEEPDSSTHFESDNTTTGEKCK